MGLTIHYTLSCPDTLTDAEASALVHAAQRKAAVLVRRLGLARIDAVQPIDTTHPLHRSYIMEEHKNKTLCHAVHPLYGWMFFVHPGEGCDLASFGLCRYPAEIKISGRMRPTNRPAWSYSGFCKTQYASLHGEKHFLKCHSGVIDLLLLWEGLRAGLKIEDEGRYWPGRDEKNLLAHVGQLNRMTAALGGALKDAMGESVIAVQSPIFEHRQFETLEAEGLSENRDKIRQAMDAIRKLDS